MRLFSTMKREGEGAKGTKMTTRKRKRTKRKMRKKMNGSIPEKRIIFHRYM